MKQTIITLTLISVIVGLVLVVVLGSKGKGEQPVSGLSEQTSVNIYYWGTTCPYCHLVSEWMDEDNIDDKVAVIRKEVYEDRQNALELSQKAKSCSINERNIGVPFLYTSDGRCLIGVDEIIDYLTKEATGSSERMVE